MPIFEVSADIDQFMRSPTSLSALDSLGAVSDTEFGGLSSILSPTATNISRSFSAVPPTTQEAITIRTYLNLDDGNGNIPFQSIVLANTGSVALTSGSLGLNSDGDLVKHNGVDAGDYLPTAQFTTKFTGLTSFSGSQASSIGLYLIDQFDIPTSGTAIGATYRVTGSTMFCCTSTSGSLPQFSYGFSPTLSAQQALSFIGVQDSSGVTRFHIPSIQFEMIVAPNTGGKFLLSGARGNVGPQYTYDQASDYTFLNYSRFLADEGASYGTSNQSNTIGLWLYFPNNTPKGSFDLQYNINIDRLN